MIVLAQEARATQNIGLIDRALRLVIGAAMIGVAYYYAAYTDTPAWSWDMWGSYAMVIALYPLFTSVLGWEPFYAVLGVRSCSDSGRNQCGTFPYQWRAMMGHAPEYCESDAEHSLEACHNGSKEHPRHKVWQVDEEPILYPDDRAWHNYFEKQQASGDKK